MGEVLETMHILVFSDIHQDWEALKKIVTKKAEIFICLGDLTNVGKGLEEAGEILAPLKEKLWLMPGNNETWEQTKALCKKFSFIDFHQKVIKISDFSCAGLGYSALTPFNTPGEASEEEFKKALKRFEGYQNLCLFAHNPPKNTVFDKISSGVHVGSKMTRDFIEKNKPIYFFSGHIHENERKIERIGKTTCFGVGKKGLELWL